MEKIGGGSSALSLPVPLSPEHDLSRFDCGVFALNEWLRGRALRNESRFSRTYVILSDDRVAAYVSISAGSADRNSAPGRIRRNAPELIPVAIIGRLAVDLDFAGRGLGAGLLGDALKRIASASRSLGIAAVMIHAKDENARRFYMKFAEFVEYPADSRTLFLPIETVAAAFEH